MSKREKLIERFKSKPKDFTFDELVTLLGYFGYYPDNKGKTSGSRIIFVKKNYDAIRIHKYHNRKALIEYEIDYILTILTKGKMI